MNMQGKKGVALSLVALLLAIMPVYAADEAGMAGKDEALYCPKCETVWVVNRQTINKTEIRRNEKKMMCPDCTSAVENFLKTGELKMTCATCGELMKCSVEQAKELSADEAQAGAGEAKPESGDVNAVSCNACEMVWVRKGRTINKVTIYKKEQQMKCPHCDQSVLEMLKSGKMKDHASCPGCKGDMKRCVMESAAAK